MSAQHHLPGLGFRGHAAKSATDEWLTPPSLVAALGGADAFDLDPASPANRPWPTAQHHYTAADNGLLLPWFGRVWLNPPYSNPLIGRFMGRLVEHGRGVALIFARTETETFFRHVWAEASAVLFLSGRLHFHRLDGTRAPGNAGAPSVLCAYGMADAEILGDCSIAGQFVPLRLPRSFAVLALAATWPELVASVLREQSGPVRLTDIYRLVRGHPKARRNRHVEAKVRQVLQQGAGRRIAPGVWEAAA